MHFAFCICYYAQIAGDDYCEPWDAKPVRSADTADYWDPLDKIPTAPPPVRKSSKDDYIDPYDAKKDVSSQGGVVKVVKKRPTKPPSREQEVDEDNEDSYDDPYDTGKVTLLDEQSKRLSIRGMRIPSVEGHQLTERDEKRGRMNIDKYDESFTLAFYSNSFWFAIKLQSLVIINTVHSRVCFGVL